MTQQPMVLTPDQVNRYSRHIIMGDVGSKGQRNLLQSKALIVGAGGLGSPSAIYLALAGVGTIGIVDPDPEIIGSQFGRTRWGEISDPEAGCGLVCQCR